MFLTGLQDNLMLCSVSRSSSVVICTRERTWLVQESVSRCLQTQAASSDYQLFLQTQRESQIALFSFILALLKEEYLKLKFLEKENVAGDLNCNVNLTHNNKLMCECSLFIKVVIA